MMEKKNAETSANDLSILLHAQYIQTGKNDLHLLYRLIHTLITLKELSYRATARELFEEYISSKKELSLELLELAIFKIYSAIGPIEKAYDLLKSIQNKIPENIHKKWSEQIVASDFGSHTHKSSRFPSNLLDRSNLVSYIHNSWNKEYSDQNYPTPIFTMGSCFAQNLARDLNKKKINVESLWLSEDINTPLTNLDYFSRLFSSQNSQLDDHEINARNIIKNSKTFVFTLGVCANFFRKKDNQMILHNSNNLRLLLNDNEVEYRHLTMAEALEATRKIVEILRNETQMKQMIITVSPVPMSAWLGKGDVISADTLSKAILRVVAAKICNEYENIKYLPSFEIFRTLPVFCQGSVAFGTEDQSPRHPSAELVSTIVNFFSDKINNK